MEAGSNSTSCMMPFGHNNNDTTSTNAVCHVSTMMHPMTSHHQHHHANLDSNPIFHIHNTSSGFSSMILDHHSIMETNDGSSSSAIKSKIMAHPHYHRLLATYVNCQKVGAPPEAVARLEEAAASVSTAATGCIGGDPALDQFMEAYCEMLIKYEQELTKPFKETMVFLQRIESQFKALTVSSSN